MEIYCRDILPPEFIDIVAAQVARARCFFVGMVPSTSEMSEADFWEVYSQFVLPALTRSGRCVVSGLRPPPIGTVTGATVDAEDYGWSMSSPDWSNVEMPFWSMQLASRYVYDLGVPLSLGRDREWLEQLFDRLWDPTWVSNPGPAVGAASLRLGKAASRADGMWLSYQITSMKIGIIAAAKPVSELYRTAVSRCRARFTVPVDSQYLSSMKKFYLSSRKRK
ncbi:MAG: hypothetical protein SF182_14655 [Deltaproteobacteria bacterium]|nr:hypothetical protein [Deltaproteobacteria bacterium]